MNATIKLENVKHFPVLLNEVISIISPLYGGTFIDCTFGEGGYSKKILENKSNKILERMSEQTVSRDPSPAPASIKDFFKRLTKKGCYLRGCVCK